MANFTIGNINFHANECIYYLSHYMFIFENVLQNPNENLCIIIN